MKLCWAGGDAEGGVGCDVFEKLVNVPIPNLMTDGSNSIMANFFSSSKINPRLNHQRC